MSDTQDRDRENREQTSIFDERPGLDIHDDPAHPENVAPDVVAPDLGRSTVFDDGTLDVPHDGSF